MPPIHVNVAFNVDRLGMERMIRAGRGGTFATDWVESGIIGIGWDFDGLDIANMDRDQIRAAYAAAYPAESKQKVATNGRSGVGSRS